MRIAKSLGVLGLAFMAACQVASGIAPLEIAGEGGSSPEPHRSDASMKIDSDTAAGMSARAGAGDSAGMSGAGMGGAGMTGGAGVGGDMSPPCDRKEGDECRWLNECGCKDPQHCQARGTDAKGTCVKRGDRKIGQTCKSPDDCHDGTCDEQVCRKYCDDRCDDGKCLPATSPDNKPIADVKVCKVTCQAGSQSDCQDGTTCQVREANGTKTAFCLPPADPCPTTEDGKCDEPTTCAKGTDSVDCSCEKPEGAMCNPIGKCGCPKGKSCEISSSGAPSCDVRPSPGLKVGEFCQDDPSCGPSSTCTFNPYGTCKAYCSTNSDCPGMIDRCLPVRDNNGKDVPGFKVCLPGCSDSVKCPEHHACVTDSDGSSCRPFKPEIPNGQCSLTLQVGCESQAGTSCFFGKDDSNQWISGCIKWPGTVPTGGPCGANGDCESGHACVDNVCKHFCDVKERVGCNQGSCNTVSFGGSDSPFGACTLPCTSDTDCVSGLHCAQLKLSETTTIKTCQLTMPLANCPTNNGRCDEPAPKGTGLCAPGADMADCMGMP